MAVTASAYAHLTLAVTDTRTKRTLTEYGLLSLQWVYNVPYHSELSISNVIQIPSDSSLLNQKCYNILSE